MTQGHEEDTVIRPARSRLFYGWVIVAVTGLTLMVAFGTRLSFSVFFVALIDEYGWTRANTSLVFSVGMAVFAVVSTPAGMAVDRWGGRRVFVVGALLLAVGLVLSSRIQSLFQITVSYGVVVGIALSVLGLGPQAGYISRWFRRRRGAAIGIAFAGTGLGTMLLIPAVAYLVEEFGWRLAYVALAGMAMSTIPLMLVFLRSDPADLGLEPDGVAWSASPPTTPTRHATNWSVGAAVRTPAFWLVMVASLTAIGPVRMLTVHQLAVAVGAGFDRLHAATVIGFGGAATAISFVSFGALSDRIGRRSSFAVGSACLLAAIILLAIFVSPRRSGSLVLYALLAGLGEGSRSSLVTAVASDLFPGRALASINGAVGTGFGLGAAIMPWLAGRSFDAVGHYHLAFAVAAAATVLSTVALWAASSYSQ